MTHFVYMLFDNLLQAPLYIGVTKSLETRYKGHLNSTIKKYINKDHVSIDILEEATENNASDTEQYWYWQIKSWGFVLLQKDCRPFKKPLKVQYSDLQIAYLATAFNCSTQTIVRWVKSSDDRLTSDRAKKALKK